MLNQQNPYIGILTSGGDAPGMNAAIRSIVRTGVAKGFRIKGIFRGYAGILEKETCELGMRSVANLLQRGGTFLKTERCLEFIKIESQKIALENLKQENIGALIVIGGDGSFQGAHTLYKNFGFPVVCIPGTIDNDIFGTDLTIGFDTALNTAIEAIDRIRDTATSHNRLFIVEVMGRNSGSIAVNVGLACGAEEIFSPDVPISIDQAIQNIQTSVKNGKLSSLLITAEGQKPGRAYDLAETIRKKSGFDAKVCILGHIQRGGAPSAVDRILACQMGDAATTAIQQQNFGVMTAWSKGKIEFIKLDQVIGKKKKSPAFLRDLCHLLSH